jgi:hypothetical protein
MVAGVYKHTRIVLMLRECVCVCTSEEVPPQPPATSAGVVRVCVRVVCVLVRGKDIIIIIIII